MTDAVIIDLASRQVPGIDVLFLDTGYHFAETIGTRDAVSVVYPVNVINVTPPTTVAEQDTELGPKLYARNPDLCCYLRKVVPLEQSLEPYDAWITGVRREETDARTDTKVVQWDPRRQMVKVNPIVEWTQKDVDDYIAEHGVLVNPLVYDGYPSIGCRTCTARVEAGRRPAQRPLGRHAPRPSAASTPDLATRMRHARGHQSGSAAGRPRCSGRSGAARPRSPSTARAGSCLSCTSSASWRARPRSSSWPGWPTCTRPCCAPTTGTGTGSTRSSSTRPGTS